MESEWKRWQDERPTDPNKLYRWRVSPRDILGLELQPEWSDKLHRCGMGTREPEYWPPFSHWDGWQRTVDATLEWREAYIPESTKFIQWNGLDLLPCPFTGMPPNVDYKGRWITAPPYLPEWLSIKSFLVDSHGWREAKRLQDAWNTRAT